MSDFYNTKGIVSEIQRFSLHDGPGIRTIVFLKGCPLRCKWCCNPENFTKEPEYINDQGKQKLVGKEMSVEEVMKEVRKDMVYYRRSNGGLTLSGGEVLMQPQFAHALLKACKKEGINTAIETCAFGDYETIEMLLPWIDFPLCDIKHIDDVKHLKYTEQSNRTILENIKKMGSTGKEVIIRVAVIPGFNDEIEEIISISKYAATIPNVKHLHLLPYHRMAEGKYEGLGLPYEMKNVTPLSKEQMDDLLVAAKEASGLDCQIGG